MHFPKPHPNPTIEVTRHDSEGWQEEQSWAIVPDHANTGHFIVLGLWEATIDGDLLPDMRDKWVVLRDTASRCRMFCAANNITPRLDWSVGSV